MKRTKKFITIVSIVTILLPLSFNVIYGGGNNQLLEEKYETALGYSKAGKLDEAIKAFQEIVNNYPPSEKTAWSQFLLADCYRILGDHSLDKADYERAIKEFQKTIDNYPEYEWAPKIYWDMGICYERMLNFDMARKMYQKVIDDYPSAKIVKLARMNLTYLDDPQLIKALIETHRYVEKGKIFQEAKEHYNNQEYSEAIAKAREVATALQGYGLDAALAQQLIGQSYEELGDYKQATKEYKKVIELAPKSEVAKEAQRRIKEIRGKQRPILIASTAGIFILVILGVFIFIKRKKKTTT